jgi:hypothetical protein
VNPWFEEIVPAGTGIDFDVSHNDDWLPHTRPIVEAFLHARYFVEMMVKYGTEIETAPQMLPSGWAAILTLYGLRQASARSDVLIAWASAPRSPGQRVRSVNDQQAISLAPSLPVSCMEGRSAIPLHDLSLP